MAHQKPYAKGVDVAQAALAMQGDVIPPGLNTSMILLPVSGT